MARITNNHQNDPLNYLPRRPLVGYQKGQVIYSGNCQSLYMVVAGRVKLSSMAPGGCEAIIKIVPPEGLFGETGLVSEEARERAVALERVQLMAWNRVEIEQQIEKDPRLGLALIEQRVVAILEMTERMQVMAACKTPQRIMLSLLQLARVLGEQQPDGAMKMGSLTHCIISEYVGTSREIVSSQMNRLRRLGLLTYSRKHIDVYCNAIEETLRSQGIGLKYAAGSSLSAAGKI